MAGARLLPPGGLLLTRAGVLSLFPLLVVALASVLVYVAGGRRLGLQLRHLRPAVARTLEVVGLTVVFLVLDLAVSVVLALLMRAAGGFVSLYLATDATLVFLAFMQALVFQRWWEAGRS
jgi:hypothetical protein